MGRRMVISVSLIALALSGCTARQEAGSKGASPTGNGGFTAARTTQRGMPCAQAARVARAALLRLGYTIAQTVRPKPGNPGSVVGHKNSGWSARSPEPGDQYTARVSITCSNQGAEFEGVTDEPWTARLFFRRDFSRAISTVAAQRVSPPRIKHTPERGLLISVEPLRSGDATSEFGADLTASGITPVRLRITNRTDRTYIFHPAKVQLVTQEGARMAALPMAKVVPAVGTELQGVLRDKQIGDGNVPPDAVLSGFLYFPASAYRRAKLVLIDQASEEAEGFSVDF